ncbi:hypothetical protein Tco_0114858, partial [Tanacetum coccineum]
YGSYHRGVWCLAVDTLYVSDDVRVITAMVFWKEECKRHLLASPKQTALELAIPGQTATGKESSNPFMAGSLPKTIHFCDSLQSDEDSFKLIELMILCTNFLTMVLDLENTKTSQQSEIASLKRSSLGDDASKQGRIDIGDINTDAEITLIDETQGRINDIDMLTPRGQRCGKARYDDHRLIHDLLVQNTTMQRELQELRDRVTTLEQEGSRRGQLGVLSTFEFRGMSVSWVIEVGQYSARRGDGDILSIEERSVDVIEFVGVLDIELGGIIQCVDLSGESSRLSCEVEKYSSVYSIGDERRESSE